MIYEGVNITNDITPILSAVTFVDELEGKSDSLSIQLENKDRLWDNDWLPAEGDVVSVTMGYAESAQLGPISFELDKLSFRYAPDTVELGGLATPIKTSLREVRAVAYENTTLRDIASIIAGRHNLTLVGSESLPNITFERVTQKHENDLIFLRRLASDYGIVFKIDSLTKLVFFRVTDLESATAVSDLSLLTFAPGARIKRENAGTYKQAKISYQNPDKGEFISVTVGLDGAVVPEPSDDAEGLIASADILNIRERVESLSMARTRAQEALRLANQSRVLITAMVEGDPELSAGNVVNIAGVGKFSGRFLLEKVTHKIANNYTTNFEARKLS